MGESTVQYGTRPTQSLVREGVHEVIRSKDSGKTWEVVTVAGSKRLPVRVRPGREATSAISRQIEADRAACTRLGLDFETDQLTYITIKI